jgi:hypothetical protein
MDVPARIRLMVEEIEAYAGPIDEPPADGMNDVRALRAYVDGEALMNCIIAHIVAKIPVPEPDADEPEPEPDTDEDLDADPPEPLTPEEEAARIQAGIDAAERENAGAGGPPPPHPLDRDGDGKAGGSPKGEASSASIGKRRKQDRAKEA